MRESSELVGGWFTVKEVFYITQSKKIYKNSENLLSGKMKDMAM